jgi:hypothetical protein
MTPRIEARAEGSSSERNALEQKSTLVGLFRLGC